MNIMVVHGVEHHGSTWHIAQELIARLDAQAEVTQFYLPRDLPEFCKGCAGCIWKGEHTCPHEAWMKPILRAMDEADVLVFTSPTYVFHCSGSMKNFLDHCAYRWIVHRPAPTMFQKCAVAVTTAAGGGMRSCLRDMTDSLHWWGVAKCWTIGAALYAPGWDAVSEKKRKKIQNTVCKIAKQVRAACGHVKPNRKIRLKYRMMRTVYRKATADTPDGAYWSKEKEMPLPWKR